MYFVETIHGVVIDVVTTLAFAVRLAKGGKAYPLRTVPVRVFHLGAQGKRVYHGGVYNPLEDR